MGSSYMFLLTAIAWTASCQEDYQRIDCETLIPDDTTCQTRTDGLCSVNVTCCGVKSGDTMSCGYDCNVNCLVINHRTIPECYCYGLPAINRCQYKCHTKQAPDQTSAAETTDWLMSDVHSATPQTEPLQPTPHHSDVTDMTAVWLTLGISTAAVVLLSVFIAVAIVLGRKLSRPTSTSPPPPPTCGSCRNRSVSWQFTQFNVVKPTTLPPQYEEIELDLITQIQTDLTSSLSEATTKSGTATPSVPYRDKSVSDTKMAAPRDSAYRETTLIDNHMYGSREIEASEANEY